MNCDQAFDCLTNPHQRESDALQRHLNACPRCRDLADALEPALTLFDDASTSFDAYSTQSEFGCEDDCGCSSQPKANRSNSASGWRSFDREVTSQDQRHRQREGAKVAIVLLLIGAFTAAIAHVGRESPAPLSRVAEIDTDACLRQHIDAHADSAPILAACLACHLDSTESLKVSFDARDRVHRIVKNCVVCHLEMSTRQELAASEFISTNACERRLTDG